MELNYVRLDTVLNIYVDKMKTRTIRFDKRGMITKFIRYKEEPIEVDYYYDDEGKLKTILKKKRNKTIIYSCSYTCGSTVIE